MAFRLASLWSVFAKNYLEGIVGVEGTKIILECHSIRCQRRVMLYDKTGDGDGGVPQFHEGMVYTTLNITGLVGSDDALGLAAMGDTIGTVTFKVDQGRKFTGSYVVEMMDVTLKKNAKRVPIQLTLRNTNVAVSESEA
jgi:hypothetical protein